MFFLLFVWVYEELLFFCAFIIYDGEPYGKQKLFNFQQRIFVEMPTQTLLAMLTRSISPADSCSSCMKYFMASEA